MKKPIHSSEYAYFVTLNNDSKIWKRQCASSHNPENMLVAIFYEK